MLKEYTLKVTCEVGGSDEGQCEEFLQKTITDMESRYGATCEITHEEIVCNDEVERE